MLGNDKLEGFFLNYVFESMPITLLFSRNPKKNKLHSALNAMFLFCKSWHLDINPAKNKSNLLVIESMNLILYPFIMVRP